VINFFAWTNCNPELTKAAVAAYQQQVGAELTQVVIDTFNAHASKLGVMSYTNVPPTMPAQQVRKLTPLPEGDYVINDESYLDDAEAVLTHAAAKGWFSNDPSFAEVLDKIATGDLRATATIGTSLISDGAVLPDPYYLIVWDPKEEFRLISESTLPDHRMLTFIHNPHVARNLAFVEMMREEDWHPSMFLSADDQQRCIDTDKAWMVIYADDSDYVDGEMVQCTVLIASTLARLNELMSLHATNLAEAANESKL